MAGESNTNAVLTTPEVIAARVMNRKGLPQARIAKLLGVSSASVCMILNGERRVEETERRVSACVNACAGLPTEVLERYKLGVIGVDYKSTKQQRDELLAALERSLESFEYIAKYGNSCGHSQLRIPDLKAAIASINEK
jgi:transcriptional regulator with XRE-family HTH domain